MLELPVFDAEAHDCAFALITRGKHVLLVWNDRNHQWSLPGGKVERDETPAFAAIRELREETGLEAAAPPVLLYVAPSMVEGRRLVYVFGVTLADGVPSIVWEREACPVKWGEYEDLIMGNTIGMFYRLMRVTIMNAGTLPRAERGDDETV